MKRRILSILLALALLCTLAPQLSLPARAGGPPVPYNGSLIFFTTENGVYDPETNVTTAHGIMYIYSGPGQLRFVGDTLTLTLPGEADLPAGKFLYYDGSTYLPCDPPPIYDVTAVPVTGGNLYFDEYIEAIVASDNGITVVEIPASVEGIPVTAIDEYAFYGCSYLEEVTIPEGVTSIGDHAFENCSQLTSITILNPDCVIGQEEPDGFTLGNAETTTIYGYEGSTAEAYATAYGYTFAPVEEAGNNHCGENVTWSYDEATSTLTISGTGPMYDWEDAEWHWEGVPSSIYSLVIEDGVTRIGANAFRELCMDEITIPNSVFEIGSGAFWAGIGMGTNVLIPESVFLIEEGAFSHAAWYDLCYDAYHPQIADGAFDACYSYSGTQISESVGQLSSDSYGALYQGTKLVSFPRYCGGSGGEFSVPDGITAIGAEAFSFCNYLTSVDIPDSVTSIGESAFLGCEELTGITVRNRDCEIYDDWWAETLGDPEITTIYGYEGSTAEAYAGQHGYTFVPLEEPPAEPWYFDEDTGLLVVCSDEAMPLVPGDRPPWDDLRSDITSVLIMDGVTFIGFRAFDSCTGMTSVTIPDSVTSIGNGAFEYCSSLTSVTIPYGVTSIGESAFLNCTSLTSVTIPDSVQSIDTFAFSGCLRLGRVTIPASVMSIGNYVFYGCRDMTEIEVASENPNYCSEDGVLFNKDQTELIRHPRCKTGSYQIPNSVTTIIDYAFEGCSQLTSVTVPDSVTSIGKSAFFVCTELREFTIPDGVTVVSSYMLGGCRQLESVTIPDSVTRIDEYAMFNCQALTSVTIPESVTSIGRCAFYYCTNLAEITILNPECSFFSQEDTLGDSSITTICGYTNSTAQAYAEEYGYTFIPLDPTGFTVVFDANGGEGEMAEQVIDFDTYAYLTKNAFTRTGYSFVNWNTAADGSGTSYVNGKKVRNLTAGEPITLYAQWKAKTYTVKYSANYGVGTMENQSATYDVPFVLSDNAFTREGYSFAGWNTSSKGTGTAYSDGETVQNLATGGTKVLYAQWAPNGYEIAFNANGGTGEMANQPMTYGVSSALTKNAFTRTGYSFASWNTEPDGSGTSFGNGKSAKNLATEGTAILYAQWKPNTYTIKYSANGGSGTMAAQTATYDLPIALSAHTCTRTGYTFTGWNTKADGSGVPFIDAQTVVNLAASGTVTLYAQWSPNSYEIAFDPNGGKGEMENQPMTYGVSAAIAKSTFTRDGYTFASWNTMADGSGTTYIAGRSAKNLAPGGTVTLYAKWKPNTITVVFYANKGTGTMPSQKLTYDVPANLSENLFTREGYTFAGWNTRADGTGTAYTDAQLVENLALRGTVKLYAQWAS